MSDFYNPDEYVNVPDPEAPQAAEAATNFVSPEYYIPGTNSTVMSFNMDDASTVIPAGPYPVVIANYKWDMRGKDPRGQWAVCELFLNIEGSGTPSEGQPLSDSWFMPNKKLQTELKYGNGLTFLIKRFEMITGERTPDGEIFNFDPSKLLWKRAVVDILVVEDDIEGEFLADGTARKYPPKNKIGNWHAISASQSKAATITMLGGAVGAGGPDLTHSTPPNGSNQPAVQAPVAPAATLPSSVPDQPRPAQTDAQTPLTASTPESVTTSTPPVVIPEETGFVPDFEL